MTICAVVALVVFWICIHPAVELAPTAFRFAAFVAAVMMLLRTPQLAVGCRTAGNSTLRIESAPGLGFARPDQANLTPPLRC